MIAPKITYILVHQARFTDATVTQDNNLANGSINVSWTILYYQSHCTKKPSAHHTFNKTFLREDMAVTGCRTAAYIYSQVINKMSQKPQSKHKRPLKIVSNKKGKRTMEVFSRWFSSGSAAVVVECSQVDRYGG